MMEHNDNIIEFKEIQIIKKTFELVCKILLVIIVLIIIISVLVFIVRIWRK